MPIPVGQFRELAARYERGETIQAIADSIGSNFSTTRRALEIQGVQFRNGRDPERDEEVARLYRDRRETRTVKQVAELMGIPERTAYHALIRLGVRRRRRGGVRNFLPQDEVERTIGLYERGGPGGLGMTLVEVGRELGRTHQTILGRLQQAGVPRRTRAEAAELRRRRAELRTPV